MNWLIWEKMFTYFYSKFRPVNCMYYIKCGVNSSLLTEFLLLHKVCGTLDHCFIMTQYSQRGWYITNLLLCDIPRNKAPRIGPCHIWRTVCPFFGCEKNTDGSTVRLMISLASIYYGDFCWGLLLLLLLLFLFFIFLKLVFNIASLRTWFWGSVSNQNFTDGFLLKFYFFPGHGSETYNRLPCLHYIWLAGIAETLYL